MAKRIFWIIFFSLCTLVGYFHGSNPNINKSVIVAPTKIGIFSTSEDFLPSEARLAIERKLNITFVYKVENSWDQLIADLVSTEAADIVLAPSYWLNSLRKQNLIQNINLLKPELVSSISSDFVNQNFSANGAFLPLYWMRIGFNLPENTTFKDYLNDKNRINIQLFADEDLIARRLKIWNEAELFPLLKSKRILTDQEIQQKSNTMDLKEVKLDSTTQSLDPIVQDALLIYGLGISNHSANTDLLTKVSQEIISYEMQALILKNNLYNTTLINQEKNDQITEDRKASSFRNHSLNNLILLEYKDHESRSYIKELLGTI